MPKQDRKEQTQHRTICLKDCETRSVNVEERTVELSFSSEEPYLRYWGYEILSHDANAMDMTRLEDSAPLLAEHDTSKQIGVVERAWIEGKRGKAVVRFSENSELAKEYFGDVNDGIRRNISVGYMIFEDEKTGVKEGEPVYTVRKWTPFEISVVSVPADETVGVGRSFKEEKKMPENIKKTEKVVDVEQVRKEAQIEARKLEGERVKEINAIGSEFNKSPEAIVAIGNGSTVESFRAQVLESFKAKEPDAIDTNLGFVGMTDKETRKYSLVKAINAMTNPQDKRAQDDASFEIEMSLKAQEVSGVKANGILVPIDVLSRDMTVVVGSGDALVSTDLMTNRFVEMLKNRSAVLQAATILPGLNGNVSIPVQISTSTAQNLAENEAMGTSDINFTNKTMSPKRVGGTVPYSKQLLAQTSMEVEQMILNDLLDQIALKIDWNALNADGTANTPVGIRNTTGIGLISLGTDGAAPTFKNFVDLETEISVANADVDAMNYVINAKGRGYVKTTPKVSGQAIFIGEGNQINGYNYRVSNQVPSTLTKGTGTNLSNITFGNFADLIIGFWGGIDITVDPYTRKKEGMIEVTAEQFYDVLVRRAASFAMIEDAAI